MKGDLEKFNITENDSLNLKECKKKVFELQIPVAEEKNLNREEWTKRRAKHSSNIKNLWKENKEVTRNDICVILESISGQCSVLLSQKSN